MRKTVETQASTIIHCFRKYKPNPFSEAWGPLRTLKRNFGAKNIVNGLLTPQQWEDKWT